MQYALRCGVASGAGNGVPSADYVHAEKREWQQSTGKRLDLHRPKESSFVGARKWQATSGQDNFRGTFSLGHGGNEMIAHGMSLANYNWPDLVFGVLATLGLLAVILGLIYLKVRGEI
jgi:hypothetical protein